MAPGQGCEPPADCLPALAGAQPPPCASHQAQKPLLSASHSTNTPPLPNRYYAINRHKATTLTPLVPRRRACAQAACALACCLPLGCHLRARLCSTNHQTTHALGTLGPYPLQCRTAPMTTASTTASSCTTSGAVPIGSAAHVQNRPWDMRSRLHPGATLLALECSTACRTHCPAGGPGSSVPSTGWQSRQRRSAAAGSRSLHEVTPEATRLERQHAAGAAGTRDADPHLVSSASIGKLFIC